MQYGLLGAGPVHQYLVSDLPRLSKELGLVAAINRRTASRIVNTLRAGEACELAEIGAARDILVCAPGNHLAHLLEALDREEIDWTGKSLVLCECTAFSQELDRLRTAGASIASLRPLAGLQKRFLVEGDSKALRVARYVVEQLNSVSIEIRPEDHLFYCASATFATSLFTPLLEGCMAAVRRTRLSGAQSSQVVEAMFLQSLRTFLYSGRKSWSGIVASGNQAGMDREIKALGTIHPELAEVYRTYAESATRLLTPPKRIRKAPEST